MAQLLWDHPTATIAMSGMIGHGIFNRLEPRKFGFILLLLLGPPTVLAFLFRASYSSALVAALIPYPIYIGALLCSLVAYRLSPFHPLARFPGPIICKVTRLWAWYIVQTGSQHLYYESLHDRYGTHVRTGPNHLHVRDASALPIILGAKGFPKGGRYDVTKLPGTNGSLLSILNYPEHAQRRRVWDRGLNTSAVQGYQDILLRRITQLTSILENMKGEIDLSSWLSFFSFDFMGDLAFGGAFHLMEQGSDTEGYIRLSRLGIRHQELSGTIAWIKPFHHFLPSAKDLRALQQFGKQSVLTRKAQGTKRKDIFYHLLDEEEIGSGPPSLPTLILESTLAIVAGSDTSGNTLSNLFYYLLTNRGALARLQAEVDEAFPPGSDAFAPAVLGEMKFLNAVINETLRLQPVVPNGVQRVIPKDSGGAMIAGRWVAGATTVQVPTYCVHRDPRYFAPDPELFLPGRWIEPHQPGHKLDLLAYHPFSYGPMNCAGKNLALLELRMVACALLQRFNVELAPGWDTREWEVSLEDTYILTTGRLPVLLAKRK